LIYTCGKFGCLNKFILLNIWPAFGKSSIFKQLCRYGIPTELVL